jgi:hypothetical protein
MLILLWIPMLALSFNQPAVSGNLTVAVVVVKPPAIAATIADPSMSQGVMVMVRTVSPETQALKITLRYKVGDANLSQSQVVACSPYDRSFAGAFFTVPDPVVHSVAVEELKSHAGAEFQAEQLF